MCVSLKYYIHLSKFQKHLRPNIIALYLHEPNRNLCMYSMGKHAVNQAVKLLHYQL